MKVPRKRKRPSRGAVDPQSFAGLIEDHFAELATRNYSAATVRGRKVQLSAFRRWCEERGIAQPAEVTRPVLEAYQAHLARFRQENGKPYSWIYQAQSLVAIRRFLRFLVRKGYLVFNPAIEIEMPRQPKRLPRAVLSSAEVEQVMAQADVAGVVGSRDRAVLEVLYSTGVRRAELSALSLGELELDRGVVWVRAGKGQRDRVVPIGERACRWVLKYLADARPSLLVEPGEEAVFLNLVGHRLSPNQVTELASRYVQAAGLGKLGSAHLFRHTMATLMLEGGADLRFIQEILGHQSVTTTQIYTRVSIRKLQEVHAATHPGARLTPAARTPASTREEQLSTLAAEGDEEAFELGCRREVPG